MFVSLIIYLILNHLLRETGYLFWPQHLWFLKPPNRIAPTLPSQALWPFYVPFESVLIQRTHSHQENTKWGRERENVLCLFKQANFNAHLAHYSASTSESSTLKRARSVHLSLFYNMSNDRLTEDLQMWADVDFAKFGFCRCLRDASILTWIIWFCSGFISTFL